MAIQIGSGQYGKNTRTEVTKAPCELFTQAEAQQRAQELNDEGTPLNTVYVAKWGGPVNEGKWTVALIAVD